MKLLLLVFYLLTTATAYAQVLSPEKKDSATIYEQSRSAIVLIITDKSQGSGVILRSDGIIATNHHIIDNALGARVKLQNGDIYDDVSIIDTDERKDIAILKIKAVNLPFLKTANSDEIKIGSAVFAIGAPRGLEGSITSGIISSIRSIDEVAKELTGFKVIQFTAPISPGSSGSPLINEYGEIVGIATATRRDSQNINIAIPINYVVPLMSGSQHKTLAKLSDTTTAERLPPKPTIEDLAGTYTGAWASNDYNVSGAIVMTLKVAGGIVEVYAVFTGSEYLKEDRLETKFTEISPGIWRMDYKGKKSKIKGTGLFKGEQFIGDYKFKKFIWTDTGQWILTKTN